MKNLFISMLTGIALVLLTAGNSFAQTKVVTGKIFQAGMQTPLSGVSVKIPESPDEGMTTDNTGRFSLKVDKFPVTVYFYKKGYEPKNQTLHKAEDIVVELFPKGEIRNDYGKDIGVRIKLNPESRDGILNIASSDNRFKYWFDNRVYLDGAVYTGDNKDIGNGVDIRRMRFAMKTILWGHWGGEIDFDFANNEVDIKDAFVRYIGKNWQIKAGNFKEPFSMEETTTSRYITFIERPMITQLAPSRHLGITFRKNGNRYFVEAGLFSSEPRNGLMQDQNKKKGTPAGWSATGRVAFAAIKKDKMVLHFGVSGSYRTPKIPELGDPTDAFRFSTRAETSINRKKYVDTDFITDANSMTLYGFETAFAYKNFKIAGEYIGSQITRDAAKVPEGEDKAGIKGFFINGGWLITNADYYYNMREAEFSQIDFRNPAKGALEVALRYSYTDANSFKTGSDIPFIQGGSSEIFTMGINYYFNYNVKVMLNYSLVNNDRWADGKGKYDTYKNQPTGKAGIDFNVIQTRIEIDF